VRKLHNEELHDPYSSPNIIWVLKSRIMRGMGEWKGAYRALVLKVMERRHLGDVDIGGRIIL
jgi:hypothetical protein